MKLNPRYLIAGLSILIVGAIIYYFSDIVGYIVFAWILSMIGAPFVRLFNKKLSPSVSAGLTLFIFALLFFLLIWMFVPTIVQQARNLAGIDYTTIMSSLEEPINDWNDWLTRRGLLSEQEDISHSDLQESLDDKDHVVTEIVMLDSLLHARGDTSTSPINIVVNVHPEHLHEVAEPIEAESDVFEAVQNSLSRYLDPSQIPAVFGSVFGFFSNFLVAIMSIFFIAFFFLRENGLFDSILTSVVPDKYVDKTLHSIHSSSRLLIRYFIGVILQITVITIFVSILLSILGVKNALLIGFFAALMNVIPYLGPLFGAAFAFLITISSNLELSFYSEMLPLLGKVALVFLIMQLLDNFILQPNIFSRSVKAHPLEIFIVVLVGAKIGGILGMVVAIPAYTVFRVIAKEFLSGFKIIQSLTKSI